MAKPIETRPGLIWILLIMLVGLFIEPIMWLAKKLNGGGCGAGPALASFVTSAFIVLTSVGLSIFGIVAIFGYLFLK